MRQKKLDHLNLLRWFAKKITKS